MKKFSGALALTFFATSASADVCDYRPSNLIGSLGTGALGATGAGVAVAGASAKAAGFYTLTHAVTGATMLGSTAGGASAAGTVGIMGGTAGAIGTIGAILMAPVTIAAGVVIGAGTAIYEGACYYSIERVDDPVIIMKILEDLDKQSDDEYFELQKNGIGSGAIYVATKVDEYGKVLKRTRYSIDKLYIEEGMLKHSDWGPNSQIGRVGYIDESANQTKSE